MYRAAAMAIAICLGSISPLSAAQLPAPSHWDWPPHTLAGAAVSSAVFGLLGVFLAVLGFKIFDWVTPGDLQKDVFEKHNIAAAVLGAAVILGICHVIASAIH